MAQSRCGWTTCAVALPLPLSDLTSTPKTLMGWQGYWATPSFVAILTMASQRSPSSPTSTATAG
jgi:hypothetical protein